MCHDLPVSSDDPEDRIAELESELADARAEAAFRRRPESPSDGTLAPAPRRVPAYLPAGRAAAVSMVVHLGPVHGRGRVDRGVGRPAACLSGHRGDGAGGDLRLSALRRRASTGAAEVG